MKKNNGLRKSDILYHIIKGWRVILLLTIIGIISGVVLIGASYIRGEVTREYKITSSFAVITTRQDVAVDLKTLNDILKDESKEVEKSEYNNLNAARSMTDTVIYIIKSQKNMQAVIDGLELRGVSANDISRNLSLTKQGETEIVEMTLLWRSEKEGLNIMDAINKVSSTTITETLKVGSISVINEPKASFIVGGNISISTLIYATVIGLLVGVGICILKFLIAPTLINENDVKAIFGIDTLGSLPLDKEYARNKPLQRSELPIYEEIKSVSHLLITHMERARAKRLYITSTIHDEGKTRLLADIAMQLSRLGKKTLLIDCDLANPKLGALFFNDLKYEQTLNSLYRGESDRLDAILHVNGCLDLLPTVLENNPEDLNDALLAELEKVMDGYDFVLIDAPPIGVDAEVLRLNEIADTVLYVVRYDDAKLFDIKNSMQRIAKSGIPVVGAVFNCVINWRQTIINTPKRMSAALKREEKKRKKEEKKRQQYQGRMEKKREMERRPDRRYLDGIAPKEETPSPAVQTPSEDKNSENKSRREKREEKKEEKRAKRAEKSSAVEKAPAVAEEPVIEAEPIIEEAPVIEAEPVVDEKPVIDEKPAVREAPLAEKKPAAKKKAAKKQAEEKIAEEPPKVKKSRSQKIAEKKAAEQAARDQEAAAKKAARKAANKKDKKKK